MFIQRDSFCNQAGLISCNKTPVEAGQALAENETADYEIQTRKLLL
jgi:hypothetical protein